MTNYCIECAGDLDEEGGHSFDCSLGPRGHTVTKLVVPNHSWCPSPSVDERYYIDIVGKRRCTACGEAA